MTRTRDLSSGSGDRHARQQQHHDSEHVFFGHVHERVLSLRSLPYSLWAVDFFEDRVQPT